MEDQNESNNFPAARKTSPLLIGFAWFFVGVPLLWGVYQTFVKSLALFQ